MSFVVDDGFPVVTRDDVSDLAGLPRRFDRFAAEVRTSFELLAEQILPAINRMDLSMGDMQLQQTRLVNEIVDIGRRVGRLEAAATISIGFEARIAALEAAQTVRRLTKTKPKRK